jgi:hypothetical protein
MKVKMTKQINRQLQFLLLTTITILFLLGAVTSTFARGKTNNLLAFDYIASNVSQNFSLNRAPGKFDLTNLQLSSLLTVSLKSVTDYPKPDFSEIEKWYEVVKYEYGDFEGGDNTLYFTLKPKSDNRPNFFVYFYDKDGAKIQGPNAALCWECSSRDSIGSVQKYHALAPTETNMKSVASVKIERIKN